MIKIGYDIKTNTFETYDVDRDFVEGLYGKEMDKGK